jgi:DNA-binding transcriptional ArsR family regulator
MVQNKKDRFSQEENDLADLAGALSHPARVAILKQLAERNVCICGEIVEVMPLAQSTVSQHLKELVKAGLITGTVDGVKSCYCINWKTFERFEKTFNAFFTQTKVNNPDCC